MKVSVAQIGSLVFDTPGTLSRVEEQCRNASSQGAQLIVFPEALLGGYPKGLNFGVTVGHRSEEGRNLFLRYAHAAIVCPGPVTDQIAAWSAGFNIHIVIGVIERDGGTLYCSGLLFTPEAGLVFRHRKLMPTAAERYLWGQGTAADVRVVDTAVGRIGIAICWENYMPLYRQHLYRQNVQLWCAPTVDAREIWTSSMRHIAYEGRCFVLSSCQHLTAGDWPADLREQGGAIVGASLIASPSGEILAGPQSGPGLLVTDIDLDDILRGKFDLDVAGHYARPDLFPLDPVNVDVDRTD